MNDGLMRVEAGKHYYGFSCKNPECHQPIIVGEIPPDAPPVPQIVSPRSQHQITCFLCGHTAVYRLEELQRFQGAKKEKLH
jgi:hypothetical protein